jgi:hypothetical protein
MSSQVNITFQEALEMIESFPEHQQEDLIEIIRQRLIEQKREALAQNIAEARAEYDGGKVKRGSVGDVMRHIQ